MAWWWIVPLLAGLLGLFILLASLVALFRGWFGTFVARLFGGGALVAISAVVLLLALDLQTYHRLSYERPVASVEVQQRGPRLYDVSVVQPPSDTDADGARQTYEMHGDEWRMEARVLKWRPWANVLGLDSQYRLDRLSGRYMDTQSELTAPRSVYDLRTEADSALDLWTMAQRMNRYAPVVDTLYGSGALMPMADDATYEVWITQSGLIARPTNAKAREASSSGWR
jgi:hypothetical protein